MNGFLKKNWFVTLVIALFAIISVYYIYDTNHGKLKGKTAGGEDVIYEINGEDTTVSQLYDSLYKTHGTSAVASLLEKAVAEQSMETTAEMKNTAAANAANIIASYQSNYPTDYRDQLDSILKQMGYSGYDDLEAYLVNYAKTTEITKQYAQEHFDDLKIRKISYILVQFAEDSEKTEEPNEDEAARMQAVDDALVSGTDFAEAAKEFSEDTSTAPNGGVLGVVDVNTSSLDEAFLNAALDLKEGEVSDWVYSSSFGFFRIRNDASTKETLEAGSETTSDVNDEGVTEVTVGSETDPYEDLVSSYDTTLSGRAIWAKAEELGIDFAGSEDLESALKSYYGIE